MGAEGIGAGIGAGVGVLQSLIDARKSDREKKKREAELLLSPWTHMKFSEMTQPRDVSPLKNIVSGAEAGFGQGQAVNQQDAWEQTQGAQQQNQIAQQQAWEMLAQRLQAAKPQQ